MRKIELLAPAGDAARGRIAVDYGADAVYIGGPKFGARGAAGNSVESIGELADYAHRFGARVYVALNTIIYDHELAEAERIARAVWQAGVDALIVQDMAYAEMALPPVPLHASTQAFNTTPEKVAFFEAAGFSRVILERALGVEQIRAIRARTSVELEAFVHGAICVSYSGRCYLSQAVAGRSGNRGECLQPCRWDYDLLDADDRRIIGRKHLLSVRDLNLSGRLEELIDAGVTSFKIEGRLKNAAYLKNSVAHYRLALDAILARRGDLARASAGETAFDFTPDPGRSFSRGFTEYYLTDADNRVASMDTPKSIGSLVGTVSGVARDHFTIDGGARLVPGDGICFTVGGEAAGTSVERVEGRAVWPSRMEGIAVGTEVFRNHDQAFVRALERSRTRRTIGVALHATLTESRLTLRADDGAGHAVERSATGPFAPAREPEAAVETIRRQLARTGGTIFRVGRVEVDADTPRFVPLATLNALRREALEALDRLLAESHVRPARPTASAEAIYPECALDYRAGVVNRLAEAFYRRHGVSTIERGFELQTAPTAPRELMRSRYCLRRELGMCLKDPATSYRGPLRIRSKDRTFALHFDCAACEMVVSEDL